MELLFFLLILWAKCCSNENSDKERKLRDEEWKRRNKEWDRLNEEWSRRNKEWDRLNGLTYCPHCGRSVGMNNGLCSECNNRIKW